MMFAIDLCRSVIPAMSRASAVTAAAAIAMIVESSFSFVFGSHLPVVRSDDRARKKKR